MDGLNVWSPWFKRMISLFWEYDLPGLNVWSPYPPRSAERSLFFKTYDLPGLNVWFFFSFFLFFDFLLIFFPFFCFFFFFVCLFSCLSVCLSSCLSLLVFLFFFLLLFLLLHSFLLLIFLLFFPSFSSFFSLPSSASKSLSLSLLFFSSFLPSFLSFSVASFRLLAVVSFFLLFSSVLLFLAKKRHQNITLESFSSSILPHFSWCLPSFFLHDPFSFLGFFFSDFQLCILVLHECLGMWVGRTGRGQYIFCRFSKSECLGENRHFPPGRGFFGTVLAFI